MFALAVVSFPNVEFNSIQNVINLKIHLSFTWESIQLNIEARNLFKANMNNQIYIWDIKHATTAAAVAVALWFLFYFNEKKKFRWMIEKTFETKHVFFFFFFF